MLLAQQAVYITDTGLLSSGIISASAGSTVNSYVIRRAGLVVQMTITVTVASLASGNLANIQVAQINDNRFLPSLESIVSSGSLGIGMTGHVNTSGAVWIDANDLAATTTNYQVSLNATYLAAS